MITQLARTPMASGILYAEDFDAPPPEPPQMAVIDRPPEIQPESFDRAALNAARQDGFVAGQRAAEADARTNRQSRIIALVGTIETLIGDANDALRRHQDTMSRELAGLVLGTLNAALPIAMREYAGTEAAAALAAILPTCDPEWSLTVSMHPETIESVRQQHPTLERRIVWQPEAAFDTGDVRVAWRHGEFRRDSAAILNAIRTALPGIIPADFTCLGEQPDVARV